MAYNYEASLKLEIKDAIRICKDFNYGSIVEADIRKAKTSDQISIILHNARCGVYDYRRKEA